MKMILIVLVSVLLSACATQKFVINQNSTNVPNIDEVQAFFINGLGQTQQIDAASVCGSANNIAHVEVQQTFIDVLLGALSAGIYTPRNARVFCLKN